MFSFFRRNTKKQESPDRSKNVTNAQTTKDNNKQHSNNHDSAATVTPTYTDDAVFDVVVAGITNNSDENSHCDGNVSVTGAHVPGHENRNDTGPTSSTMKPIVAFRGKGKGKRKVPQQQQTVTHQKLENCATGTGQQPSKQLQNQQVSKEQANNLNQPVLNQPESSTLNQQVNAENQQFTEVNIQNQPVLNQNQAANNENQQLQQVNIENQLYKQENSENQLVPHQSQQVVKENQQNTQNQPVSHQNQQVNKEYQAASHQNQELNKENPKIIQYQQVNRQNKQITNQNQPITKENQSNTQINPENQPIQNHNQPSSKENQQCKQGNTPAKKVVQPNKNPTQNHQHNHNQPLNKQGTNQNGSGKDTKHQTETVPNQGKLQNNQQVKQQNKQLLQQTKTQPKQNKTQDNSNQPIETHQQQNKSLVSYASVLHPVTQPLTPSVKPCSHVPVAAPPGSPVLTPRSKKNVQNVVPNEEKEASVGTPSETAVNSDVKLMNNEITVEVKRTDVIVNSDEGIKHEDNDEKKSLVNQETKFQTQLAELTERLRVREAETSALRFQMEDLQRDVYVKSSGVDRLQAELQAAYKDSEFVRQKLKHLQEEVHVFKQKNCELADEIQKKSDEYVQLEETSKQRTVQLEASMTELTEKLTGLEAQLTVLKQERDRLEQQQTVLEAERDEEKKIVQEALEAAMEEKESIKKRWEEDFEKLRTVNTDREQQMLDDFEWKLREVQQMCKRRLEEKDKQAELKIKEVQKGVDEKVKQAESQLNEAKHLKSYEAEVTQLRGLTHDQQHSLRAMSSRVEQLILSEDALREEISRLQAAVEIEHRNQESLVRKHEKDITDRERTLQIRLEKQKGEVAVQWEQKLRQECARLKSEMEQLHTEERLLAIELVKVQKDREFEAVKKEWDSKHNKQVKEIHELRLELEKKEERYQLDLERLQTNTDRDIVELRRELDRAEMSYHEKVEKMMEEHEQELERLNEEADRRIKEMEQNCQMQVSSMRATLELVKEQMERETEDRIQQLVNEHARVTDAERDRLSAEKHEEIDAIEHGYKCKFEMLKEKFTTVQKSHQLKETELLQKIDGLNRDLGEKKQQFGDLQANVDTLHGGVQVLNQQIANQDQKYTKIKTDAEQKIGELQHALKIERDTLLVEREEHSEEISHMQKQSQTAIEQLQRKCQCLTKLFEEMRSRYENREPRPEDLTQIEDLRSVIAEQEKDLSMLNEENRFFQMELMRYKQEKPSLNHVLWKNQNGVIREEEEEEDEVD